jgi:DNA-binding cell septation regulator SpoVG
MEIRIVRFVPAPLSRPRSVLALARITLAFENHQVTLDDLRLIQNRQNELWIGMPSMKDANGVYQPIIEFTPELKRQIDAKILPAYREWAGAARAAQEVSRG